MHEYIVHGSDTISCNVCTHDLPDMYACGLYVSYHVNPLCPCMNNLQTSISSAYPLDISE